MEMSQQIKDLLEKEDRIIEVASVNIEAVLSSIMDTAMSNFGNSGQFVIPGPGATEQLVDALTGSWSMGITLGTEQLAAMLVKQDQLTARAMLEYLNSYGFQRSRQIVSTTARQLTQIVVAGQRQGHSTTQIMRDLINKVPKLAASRAKIIAETEVHSATQFGSYNAALRSQKLLKKIWNTREDDKVRDFLQGSQYSHALAQGQKKALDNSFQIPHISGSTEALRFPGDPEGSAGNIIKCRCVMTFEEL